MRGGTPVEERRERPGACKCARQGSHLGPLRLGSSAQGPGWGREGGGEGEEGQPLSHPGAGVDLSLQERVLVVLRNTALGNRLPARSPGAARLGHHLSFYSNPPPPSGSRLELPSPPRGRSDSQAQREDFRFLKGGVLQSGDQVLKHRVLTP